MNFVVVEPEIGVKEEDAIAVSLVQLSIFRDQ